MDRKRERNEGDFTGNIELAYSEYYSRGSEYGNLSHNGFRFEISTALTSAARGEVAQVSVKVVRVNRIFPDVVERNFEFSCLRPREREREREIEGVRGVLHWPDLREPSVVGASFRC